MGWLMTYGKQDGLGEILVARTPAYWKLEGCNTENFFPYKSYKHTLSTKEGPSTIPWWVGRY